MAGSNSRYCLEILLDISKAIIHELYAHVLSTKLYYIASVVIIAFLGLKLI